MKIYYNLFLITLILSASANAQLVFNGQDNIYGAKDIELVDVDNDNDLDIISGRSTLVGFDREQVWLNNGNGIFSSGQSIDNNLAVGNDQTQDIEAYDLNNDGFPEFVAANINDNSILYYNTNGMYSNQQNLDPSLALVFGDHDNDGDDDLFTVEFDGALPNNYNIFRYQNNAGAFVKLNTPIISSENEIVTIKSNDINSDGYDDLVLIIKDVNELNGENNRVLYYRYNNSDDTYSKFLDTSTSYVTRDLELVDIDGDNDIDVVVVLEDVTGLDSASNIVVYKNYGNDSLLFFSDFGLGSDVSRDVTFGDLDGDGDLDAFVSNYGVISNASSPNNSIWENDGQGNFSIYYTSIGINYLSNRSEISELADLDGDGDLDIVVCSTQSLVIWFNEFNTSSNTRPIIIDTFGDINQLQGSTVDVNIDLTQYFDDAEENAEYLNYKITSSNPSYFSTSIIDAELIINFTSDSGGPEPVVIEVSDSNGYTISQGFQVRVAPIPCPNPGLSVGNITDSSFRVSWQEVLEVDPNLGYNWYLMNESENPSEDIPIQSGQTLDTMIDFTGLQENTTYDVYIQTICPFSQGLLSQSITVTTDFFSCEPPTSVMSEIINSNIFLSWDLSQDAILGAGYNWYVLPSGSVNLVDAIESGSTPDGFVILNTVNYETGSSYDVYITSICSLIPLINSDLSILHTFIVPVLIPNISISAPVSVTEDIGTYIIDVTSDIQVSSDVIVNLSLSGTADTSDYSITNTSITIPNGFSSTSLIVSINDDFEIESNETLVFDIDTVVNGVEDGIQQVTTILLDNDSSNSGLSFFNSGQNITTFSSDVVLGDFNNNLGLDAIVSSSFNNDYVCFNDGFGALNLITTIQNIGPTAQVALGDFDASGIKNDIFLVKSTGELWINNNMDGSYSKVLDIGSSLSSAVAFDLNNDTADDLIIVSTNGFSVLYNNIIDSSPNHSFNVNQTVSESNINDIKVAYVNNDTYPDIVLARNGENKVYFGNSDGMFTNFIGFGDSQISTAVAAKDLNNDGLDDVVFANLTANPSEINRIYISNNTSFTQINIPPTLDISSDVSIADFDNDGDFDIVFANYGANVILENTINGYQVALLLGNSTSTGVDTGDIDGDGDIDIIFSNNDTNGSQIWFNNLQTLSNQDFDLKESFNLYPNPVKHQFKISNENGLIEKVQMFNLQGQLVKSFELSVNYDIDDLESGVYFVNIQSNNTNSTIKIIKE